MTLSKVGMHYAVNVLFTENPHSMQVFNYNIQTKDLIRFRGGQQVLCMGRAVINSKVTLSIKHLSFAVLYLGNHHIIGGTSDEFDEGKFKALAAKLEHNFQRSHIASVIHDIEQHFGSTHFSFFDLMKDEQKKILKEVIDSNVNDASSSIERIAKQNYSLLNLMRQQELVIPHVLWQNLVTKTEHDLRTAIIHWGETGEFERLFEVLDQFDLWKIYPDTNFEYKLKKALKSVIDRGFSEPGKLIELLSRLEKLKINMDRLDIQNFTFRKLKDGENGDWRKLGEKIQLEV